MATNDNYDTYLGTATQIQRWRDFSSHLTAYLAINSCFILIWLASGRGSFWPAYPLIGWAIGLSFQHFNMTLRGPISDDDVLRRMTEPKEATTGNEAWEVAGRSGRLDLRT
jgi:2TM domain